MIEAGFFSPLGRLTHWERTERGIRADVDDARLVIDVIADDLFRIGIPHRGNYCDAPSPAVCADLSLCASEFAVGDDEEAVWIDTGALRIVLKRSPFHISAHRRDGSAILEASTYARLNDGFLVTRRRAPDDVVLGLGQKTGRLDRNGRAFTLWNTDVLNPEAVREHTVGLDPGDPRSDPRSDVYDPYYISIPFYQSLDVQGRAAGFFVDNVHRARFDFSGPDETHIRFDGGRYVEYVFAGPSLPRIVEGYTALTGRMAAPPLWSLGYHHCRWHPYAQTDVIATAERYRAKGIPCDSIWLDIDHMEGYRVFTWNAESFPDPRGMLDELRQDGFRAVTIVDPGVKVEPGDPVYDAGLAANAFCRTEGGAVYEGQAWPGRTAFPDFPAERARAWWGELNAEWVRSGLAGIWNDMNEPATGMIPYEAMRFDGGRHPHGTYHNAYALLMAMGTVEGLRKAMPDGRPFVLSRAGSAGIQRVAANWLGDNMSRWEHLAMSLPMSLGLGLSGQPFVGADIGGFGEDCEPELLVRWFQAAALSPFCRHHNHAGCRDQYPWSFGGEVERICGDALRLRYRPMPYLYSAFVEATESGSPVMRPLVFDHQDDPSVRGVDDQYLLGPSLLVAPIVERGARSRSVVLPEGTWIDWWSDAPAERGRIGAPLDRIPLFARAGAVVPLWPMAPPSTMGYRPETVELHLFVPVEDGTFVSTLVEDDGETLGYTRGERLVTTFRVTRRGGLLQLEATTEGKPYKGFARRSFRVVLRGTTDGLSETSFDLSGRFVWTADLGGARAVSFAGA